MRELKISNRVISGVFFNKNILVNDSTQNLITVTLHLFLCIWEDKNNLQPENVCNGVQK